MIDIELNNRFRLVLQKTGLSQEKFGEQIGMTRSEISNIVYDKTNIKPGKIHLMCQAYGIREAWFLTGDGEMYAPEDLGKAIGRIAREASGNREEVVQFFEQLCARVKSDEELEAEILLMYTLLKRRFGPLLDGHPDPEEK